MTMNIVKNGTPPHAPKRMRLDAVTTGRVQKPVRVLLSGPEGLGKSTWASNAPAPIFLGAEDGTAQLDVARLPEPRSWDDVLDAVETLTVDAHDYKTFVIDTLDWVEPLCWAHVCRRANKPDIESFGFGKGYSAALDEWRILLARLDALRAKRGMNIVLLAHIQIRTFKNPDAAQGDYDRYELKLHSKTSGLVKEWSDCVLFANYETFTTSDGGRTRGVSSGARLIHTERTAAWDAKNRYGLPPSMPLSWDDFAAAVQAGEPDDPARLLVQIEALLSQVDSDTRSKTETWLAKGQKDARKLSEALDRLRGKIQLIATRDESEADRSHSIRDSNNNHQSDSAKEEPKS